MAQGHNHKHNEDMKHFKKPVVDQFLNVRLGLGKHFFRLWRFIIIPTPRFSRDTLPMLTECGQATQAILQTTERLSRPQERPPKHTVSFRLTQETQPGALSRYEASELS